LHSFWSVPARNLAADEEQAEPQCCGRAKRTWNTRGPSARSAEMRTRCRLCVVSGSSAAASCIDTGCRRMPRDTAGAGGKRGDGLSLEARPGLSEGSKTRGKTFEPERAAAAAAAHQREPPRMRTPRC
jgi:hypothetical protein